MNKQLLNKFIALPMAITVFKQDYKTFEPYRAGNLYQDKLQVVIDQMKKDFYKIKSELVRNNTQVRLINQCKYNVNGEIIEYGTDELKELTANIMHHYLHTVDFEIQNRIWNDVEAPHKG